MTDRFVAVALGVASIILPWVLSSMFPKLPKWVAWSGLVVGILLVVGAVGTLFLPVDAQPQTGGSGIVAPGNSGIIAPGNGGIITQGQSGGTNVVNPPAAGKVGDDSVVMGRTLPGQSVGNRSVVIGPTDTNGNTVITPMVVGHGACGGPGDTVIGADAGTCPKKH